MIKTIFISSLCLLSITVAYPQSGSFLTCNTTLENIFKAHDLKIKYEAAQSLYRILGIQDSTVTNKRSFLHISRSGLNTYFEAIKGHPMEAYESPVLHSEQTKDSISRSEPVPVMGITHEEMSSFVKQLNCRPQEVFKEYMGFIQDIKSEREKYVKCIDTELAKGNLSEFATAGMLYTFVEAGSSIIGPPGRITKLDYLKIFKEFIFTENEEILPGGTGVYAYLNREDKTL